MSWANDDYLYMPRITNPVDNSNPYADASLVFDLATNGRYGVIDPISSFYEEARPSSPTSEPYFNVTSEELQNALSLLNIQNKLSKSQMNFMTPNGYRQKMVFMHAL